MGAGGVGLREELGDRQREEDGIIKFWGGISKSQVLLLLQFCAGEQQQAPLDKLGLSAFGYNNKSQLV